MGIPGNVRAEKDVQPKTVDFFAEVLYWCASETVDWAFTLTYDAEENLVATSYKTFAWDFAPGFRLGA